MEKKKIFRISMILLLIVFSVIVIYTYDQKICQDKVIISYNEETINESIISLLENEYQNNDIIGYLVIKDVLEVPLVQSSDNSYYLNHNIYGEKDSRGATFLDYRNNINDQKILIYGHMSRLNRTPFSKLKNFLDEDYFNSHEKIYLETNEYHLEYQIFGLTIYDHNYTYLNLSFDNQNTYLNNLNEFINRAMYYKKIDISENDNTLFIQTCYPNKENTYIVLGAKLINKYNYEGEIT